MGLRGKYEIDIIALDALSVTTMGAGQAVNSAYRYSKLDRASRKMLNAGINFLGGAAGLGGVTKDLRNGYPGNASKNLASISTVQTETDPVDQEDRSHDDLASGVFDVRTICNW